METQEYQDRQETGDLQIPEETLEQKFERLQTQLAELKAAQTANPATAAPKNHQPGKPDANRKYQLLSKSLNAWGKVPQQQADLAKLLADNFEVNEEIPEAELFRVITEQAPNFKSLAGSKQHPTYLFKYYRGLKPSGNHAGFIARDFLIHD